MTHQPASSETTQLVVSEDEAGERLDVFLARHFSDRSRVHLRRVIQAGGVTVDGERVKVAYRLIAGQQVNVTVPELPREGPQPEQMPLDVLYEDEHLAAINKPPGMVVHPSKGHWSGTLVAGLAWHFQNLSTVGGAVRPGIVHRLDRDTSGVIVVAKTDAAHLKLAEQFQDRTTEKEYAAIVYGVPDRDADVIDLPIGAHPYQREKMALRRDHATSRDATTLFEVAERFPRHALLKVSPKTGRTHQIRVHLAHVGHPVVCDKLYSGRSKITSGEITDSSDATELMDRQALHARRLKLRHPATGEPVEFTAPTPEDFERLLAVLRKGRTSSR